MPTERARIEELEALLERVRAAKGPDQALGCEVVAVLLDNGPATDPVTLRLGRVLMRDAELDPAILASLDAAVDFLERVVPGANCEWRREHHRENGHRAQVWCSWGPKSDRRVTAECIPTRGGAVVAALLMFLLFAPEYAHAAR